MSHSWSSRADMRYVDLEAAAPAPSKRRPIRRRPARAGELRAVDILSRFERAGEDPDESLDLRERCARLSPLAQRYVRLLVDDGALSDRAAAHRLGCKPTELGPALSEVNRVFARE